MQPRDNVDFSSIRPTHFYTAPTEKIKFNWFAFELACEIDRAVPTKFKTLLAKRGYPPASFNRACVILAKRLQAAVAEQLKTGIQGMRLDYVDIEKAFPGLNDKIVDELLTHTASAWDALLGGCCVCPTACLSHKDEPCTMFDDNYYYKD